MATYCPNLLSLRGLLSSIPLVYHSPMMAIQYHWPPALEANLLAWLVHPTLVFWEWLKGSNQAEVTAELVG